MKMTVGRAVVAAVLALPMSALATIYTFNASLAGTNENPPNPSPATGLAILSYNDFGTPLDVADDRYNFALSVFNLSDAPSAYHIHGAATLTENAPVRIDLDKAPFVFLEDGGTLLVGGNGITPPVLIAATPASATNAGHPAMTMLAMLQGGLAYVNVHTPLPLGVPSGEVRGQLIQVTAVPEPETYALMLAGLSLVGWAVSRRRKVGV